MSGKITVISAGERFDIPTRLIAMQGERVVADVTLAYFTVHT